MKSGVKCGLLMTSFLGVALAFPILKVFRGSEWGNNSLVSPYQIKFEEEGGVAFH